MKVAFMGTPDFAIPTLQAIIKAGYEVVGVITAPDKPAGRGKKLSFSPVKKFAIEKGLKLLQPEKLKDPEFLEELKGLKPDVQVIVAFRMLPEAVWSIPELGTFNLHASLLPHYRGAAPINRAIMNGEKETGLTTFFIDDKIDTGEILLQQRIQIRDNETAGELHDRMMVTGADLVVETLERIKNKSIETVPQTAPGRDIALKTAAKIFKEDCKINWNSNSLSLHNFIRGLSPYPAAYTIMETPSGEIITKIYSAKPEESAHKFKPGTIQSDGKTFLKVATAEGLIDILELQLAGKKRLNIRSFLAGFKEINSSKFI